MSKKPIIGLIIIIIGAILMLIAGFSVILVQIPSYEMQIQSMLAYYRPYYPTINITGNYSALYINSIFMIMVAVISIVCGVLMLKKISKAAIACSIIGFLTFALAFVPIGYVTLTVTGAPLTAYPIPVTLGGAYIIVDPFLISIGGIVGYFGIRSSKEESAVETIGRRPRDRAPSRRIEQSRRPTGPIRTFQCPNCRGNCYSDENFCGRCGRWLNVIQ